MEDNTLKSMMMGILIIFIIGLSSIIYFLTKETLQASREEKNTLLFKIEVGLLFISVAGLIISIISLLEFF